MKPNKSHTGCRGCIEPLIAIAIIILMICVLNGCKEVDREIIANTRSYTIEKVKVDSVQYLIVRTNNGVAIIKHAR